MELLRYLAEAAASSAVFWLIYACLLRNRPHHRVSRAYLLLALALPGILPLIQLPEAVLPHSGVVTAMLPPFSAGGGSVAGGRFDLWWSLPVLYFAGSLLLAGRRFAAWLSFRRRLARMPAEKRPGYLLQRGTGMGPGTVWKRIFLPADDAAPGVLAHELAHIRCGHRYDLILLLITRSLFWISPAHWLLGRELRIVHEFEADRIASAGPAGRQYAQLLLHVQFGLPGAPLFGHGFFHHPLTRRIMMLQRTARRSAAATAIAILLTAGFATTIVLAQSGSQVSRQRKPLDAQTLRNNYMQPRPGTVSTMPDGRIVFSKAEQMPQFDGNLYQWLLQNVRSPQKDMEGKVVVQFTVDVAGNVTMPFISQSSKNALLDAEALRVVNAMPKWKPGMQGGKAVPVQYQLPFRFGHLNEGGC